MPDKSLPETDHTVPRLVPTRPDAELAAEFKRRLVEAYGR